MTDKNDALFLVRLPFGPKTIPYEEVPGLIAMAKSPGYDGEHEAVMLALDVCNEEGPLRAAVQAGEVEVLDKSFHRMTQPSNRRLEDAVLTVQALREYVESIKGFLEVEDAPQAASAGDDVEEQAPDAPAAKVEAGTITTPAPAAATVRTNQKIWDDSKLKALWEQSIMPGVTTTSLAKKHGVSRQRIATLIKTAKEKFKINNSWQNSSFLSPTRVVKGSKY